MEIWVPVAIIAAATFLLVLRLWQKGTRKSKVAPGESLADAIDRARRRTRALATRGAIFEITPDAAIPGYHLTALGPVRCACEAQNAAKTKLRQIAVERYPEANVLTNLARGTCSERYVAGTGPKGNPYYRSRKVTTWDATACEAIPDSHAGKSRNRWRAQVAVVDGSNVAHWGGDGPASLDAVRAVLRVLREEGVASIVVFDASIGYRVGTRQMGSRELARALGRDSVVETVRSGTDADRRIIELAEQNNATIVSNDFFRDNLRAQQIPKRRGFFLPEHDHAELTDPRR